MNKENQDLEKNMEFIDLVIEELGLDVLEELPIEIEEITLKNSLIITEETLKLLE